MVLEQPDRVAEDVFVFPASFAQQRLWFIDQLMPGTSLYTIPLVFRLTGLLDHAALEQSLQSIVDRHESLRTTFERLEGDRFEGQLMQIITPVLPVSLPLVDLWRSSAPSLSAVDREAIAMQQIQQETQRSFQLSQSALFRVRLWQLDEAEHLLWIALHHIIFDEWSSGVFIRELGAGYAKFAHRQAVALPDLPIQYADFAHWQRQWLQGEVLNRQLSYWRRQLQDVPPLAWPAAPSRPLAASHRGASQQLELPQALLDALESLSQQAGVTLFMTLLAAFQTLLYRHSGQEDIAIGSPVANRPHSELEGLIGFFVNSLVLRTDLSGDPSFSQLLQRVKQTVLEAQTHQDVPFEKLVEELRPARQFNQNPLFQVVFALQNTPIEQLHLPGLTLSPVEFETQITRFNLELYVWKCGDNFRNLWGKGWQQSDGLRGVVIYNTDLFDDATIAQFRQQLQTLLTGITIAPDTPLSRLPLLTAQEQQQALSRWHRPATDYPKLGIHQLFEAQARQHPQAIALQFADRQFTYEALDRGSNQLGRYLQKRGVTVATRVGICLERTAEAIAAMLAVLKAGGAYVPLDPSYPAERLQYLIEDAQLAIVLTRSVELPNLDSTQMIDLSVEWGAIAQESEASLSVSELDLGADETHLDKPNLNKARSNQTRPADRLAYIMYTSGSTGTPKGVMVPHCAVNRLVCQSDYLQIQPGDRVAQVASLAFDAATFEIWGALLNGARLVGMARETTLSPIEFSSQLQQQQISILFLTTALFNQTVSQVPDAFRSLACLLFGGETANPERVRSVLQQGKPQRLIHVYGPTENTTFSTWYEVRQVAENATAISIGQAIANTQVYVLDKHLTPVPPGVEGEIYLGGDGLAQGYWRRSALSAERFVNHPELNVKLYRTGDRARCDAEGNLEFLGRGDRQVKLRGFRIEPGEIEAALMQHAAVQTAVVTVCEVEADRCDATRQPRQLVAYLVPFATQQAVAHPEVNLRPFLKAKLPAYLIPAHLVWLDELPLTHNGKVDWRSLPPPVARRLLPPSLPQSSIELALVEIWQQLLGQNPIGTEDNFFELGGHSLLATQLVSRIRDRLQVELPLRSLFENPTIAELAPQVEAMRDAAMQSSPESFSQLSPRQSLNQLPGLSTGLPQREEIEL